MRIGSPVRPLFVASLGNPFPSYANTLHSAGHTLLTSLLSSYLPPPLPSPGSSPISVSPSFKLFYSRAYMNVSGPPLAAAWRTFLRGLPSSVDPHAARLVVLHDELESPLGRVKMKVGGSVKGHNGLRSCRDALGEKGFVRIGVGIGRPESRERDDVSRFVLRRMRGGELEAVGGAAGEVRRLLEGIREGSGEGLKGWDRGF